MKSVKEFFKQIVNDARDTTYFLIFLMFATVFALGWCYCPDVMQETIEVKVWELGLLCLLLLLKLPKSLISAIKILREWNVWILDKEKGWIRACRRR
ncbi:hypothetical protein DRJ19_04700 [Candidatus Woesearchaeota archaeon]|nr:MAG: hypothetical protein DRJ19_04700 [Candidatus Woesearchaeota archaeon]